MSRSNSSHYDHRMGIYRITHIESGREYIGSAMDFHVRLGQHLSKLKHDKHHSKYLQRIYNKYGVDSLEFDILEIVEMPEGLSDEVVKTILLEHEQVWLDDRKPVMNSSPTAGSTLGFKHSEESKALIRQILRDRPPASEETRAKISAANKGKTLSEEARAKISQSLTGHVRTAESRARQSASTTGVPKSPEHRQAMSEAQKKLGEWPNLKNNLPGHPFSEKARQALLDANLGKKQSPEHRAKSAASRTGLKQSEETKAKKSASMKAFYARKKLEEEQQQIQEDLNGDTDPREAA